jgi:hypothetical protein
MFRIRVKTGHKNTVRPVKTTTCMVDQVPSHSPRNSIRAEASVQKRFCQLLVQRAVFARIKLTNISVREGLLCWTDLPVTGFYTYPEHTPIPSCSEHLGSDLTPTAQRYGILATTSWVIVSFSEMERSRGYRGIIKNHAHWTPDTDLSRHPPFGPHSRATPKRSKSWRLGPMHGPKMPRFPPVPARRRTCLTNALAQRYSSG